jgi:hypothetical protein
LPTEASPAPPRIPLLPGDRVFFERQTGGRKVRTSAAFLGLKGTEFVLTEPPMVSGSPLFTAAGATCVVRFMYQGVVHGFTSTVAYVVYNPFPMLCLRYPSALETINLRMEARFTVNIAAVVTYKELDQEKTLQGNISDLSPSGCRLELPIFFDTGDKFQLTCQLPDGSQVPPFEAEVRNLRTDGQGRYEYGLRFNQTPSAIAGFVQQLAILAGS